MRELMESHAEVLAALKALRSGLQDVGLAASALDRIVARAEGIAARVVASPVDRAGGTATVSGDGQTADVGGSEDTWSAGQGEADA